MSPPDINRLSRRQKEILRLVGQYMQAKEVARKLKIRETTVRTHMDEARRRLGVSTSREAARLLLEFERSEALLNDERPQGQRIGDPGPISEQSVYEQALRAERTVSYGPLDGSGASLDDARITRQASPDSRRDRNHTHPRPVPQPGKGGLQHDRRHRLADRRWALFERRLENLRLWQWLGIAVLAAFCMTAAGGGLIQGALSMFGLFHEMQRHAG